MDINRFPPWSLRPSLSEMTAEAGIDFDQFVEAMRGDQSLAELAEKFQVSENTVDSLREHFFRYGISSVVGGD